MKNLFIFTIALLAGTVSFAQGNLATGTQTVNTFNPYQHLFSGAGSTLRTTAAGDTLVLSNIADTASLVIYTAATGSNDSGYLTGTNYLLDQGFAEHYYVNGNDSTLSIIGVFAQFGGYVSDTSTQSVSFNIWGQSPAVPVTDTLSYSGFPSDVLDTLSVPFSQLGIGPSVDTLKLYLFALPTPVWGPFFTGYTINGNYTFSTQNNIGLAATRDSLPGNDYTIVINTQTYPDTFYYGDSAYYSDTSILSTDTLTDTTENIIINVRNATMKSDYAWYDNRTQDDAIRNHLAIYPVVVIQNPNGIKSITNNNLTFFGNYPNPAVDYTNIKFSLLRQDNVTISIMDARGRVVNTMLQNNVEAGVHIIPVNTSSMSAGDYIYLIRTASGDGMAGKMTVIRY